MLNQPEKALHAATRRVHAGDTGAALRILDELLSRNPFHLEARAERARLRFLGEDFEGAIEDAAVILQVRPGDDAALTLSGECHTGMGRHAGALKNLLAALERNPRNRAAIAGLARLADELEAGNLPPQAAGAGPEPLRRIREFARASGDPRRFQTGMLVFSVITTLRPAAVMELGALDGFVSLTAGLALQQAAPGHLHCVGDYTADFFGAPQAAPAPPLDEMRGRAHELGFADRVFFHQREDAEETARDFLQLARGPRLVIAHTDSRGGRAWPDALAMLEAATADLHLLLLEHGAGEGGGQRSPELISRLRDGRYGSRFSVVNLGDSAGTRIWLGERLGGPAEGSSGPSPASAGLMRRILGRRG